MRDRIPKGERIDRLEEVMLLVLRYPEHYNNTVWHEDDGHCFLGFAEIVQRYKVDYVDFSLEGLLESRYWTNKRPAIDQHYFGITKRSFDAIQELENAWKYDKSMKDLLISQLDGLLIEIHCRGGAIYE